MDLPDIPPDRDSDHLHLLAIFHFIYGGFSLLGLVFLYVHYSFVRLVFTNPQMMEQMRRPKNGEPMPFDPETLVQFIVGLYLFIGAIMVAMAILNLASGLKLQARRSRTFIMVVAAFNCLGFPLGTVLGVCTLVVVQRESVRLKFASYLNPAHAQP